MADVFGVSAHFCVHSSSQDADDALCGGVQPVFRLQVVWVDILADGGNLGYRLAFGAPHLPNRSEEGAPADAVRIAAVLGGHTDGV